jgi:hypothetical protein
MDIGFHGASFRVFASVSPARMALGLDATVFRGGKKVPQYACFQGFWQTDASAGLPRT